MAPFQKSFAFWIKVAAAAVIFVIWAFAWRHFSAETLIEWYGGGVRLIAGSWQIALPAYIILYAAIIAVGIPAASLLTLMGGAAFGWIVGGSATLVAATAGACGLFLLARGLLKDLFERLTAARIERVAGEFHTDAAGYLLVARLTPVFPFTLVTIAAALLGARFSTFAWTTLVGIIPAVFAYSLVGSGLDQALRGEAARLATCVAEVAGKCRTTLAPADFVRREIVWGLAALAMVMFISLLVRRFAARRPGRD